MSTPAETDPTAWTLFHKPSGHKYILHMLPSKESAQVLAWKRKRLWTLFYDYQHAKDLQERVSRKAEYEKETKWLERVGRALMQDCLGDQIKGMPEEQLWEMFASMINYFEKEGPSEIQ